MRLSILLPFQGSWLSIEDSETSRVSRSICSTMTTLLILTVESESIILSYQFQFSFQEASATSSNFQLGIISNASTISQPSVLQYTWLLLHSFFLSFWSKIVTHSSSRRSTSSHLQVSFQSLHLFSSYPFPFAFSCSLSSLPYSFCALVCLFYLLFSMLLLSVALIFDFSQRFF